MNWGIKESFNCDVVVIGAGLAGIRAAYDLLSTGKKVAVVTSQSLCSGSSFSPFNSSLRAQLPSDEKDVESYTQSLTSTGKKMANEKMYRIIAQEITKEVKRLEQLKIPVTFHRGRAACFSDTERLLAQIRDWKEIRKNVNKVFSSFDNFALFENCDLQQIIKSKNKAAGVLVLDKDNSFIRINSQFTVLATGGYCGLYQHSLNTKEICGIGHSVALDAGCDLINMEFSQFIPALIAPKNNLLFGEIILKYCNKVEDKDGNEILKDYLPEGLSVRECLDLRSTHGPFTTESESKYLDILMMEQSLKSNKIQGLVLTFDPSVMESDNFLTKDTTDFYLSKGIDLSKDKITIAPFAHCSNGGIVIDEDGQTQVENLFAAGECTGGIHGAERQGGAATATSIVFGARVARKINELFSNKYKKTKVSDKSVMENLLNITSLSDGISPTSVEIQKELGEKLWMTAGIIRSETLTRPTYNWVVERFEHYNVKKQVEMGQNLRDVLKTYHCLRVAKTILQAILERRESRGGHFRMDFSDKDDKGFSKRIIVN